jgi:carbon storage regulator
MFMEERRMLVLARKEGEGIEIGDHVTVQVIKTGRRSVRLGIEAPEEIPVSRSELFREPGSPHRLPHIELLCANMP